MEIKIIDGDITNSSTEIIIHQCNVHTIGSGVAKALCDKWPIVKEKHKKAVSTAPNTLYLLGKIQVVNVSENKKVINLFAQESFGYDGRRYTSYDAIDTCLHKVAMKCEKDGIKSIALPYHMSCDRGGANWNIIMEMIKQHFNDLDITIEIWKL